MNQAKFIKEIAIAESNLFYSMIQYLKEASPEDVKQLVSVVRTNKTGDDNPNKGQWGYYVSGSNSLVYLVQYMKSHKLKRILDLGCGVGHVLRVLRQAGIYGTGIEIEQTLVDIGNQWGINIEQGDILKPFNSTDFDSIYFYEPIAEPKLAKKFVDNLVKCTQSGQYIFYKRAGSIGKFIDESKQFRRLNGNNYFSEIRVYKRK